MSIWRLTIREISHRKVHFFLGLLSITAAVTAYIATTMLLRDSAHHDRLVLVEMEADQKGHLVDLRKNLEKTLDGKRTELEQALADTQAQLRTGLENREKAVAEAGAALQDAMRKITKGLGFNILILPRDQDINQFHLQGVADAVMPEAFVTKLANSKIVTINHLLPVITKRIRWIEQDNFEVVLIGTRGEVPLAHRDPK
ncbi:uncharacterized protein METZ01_LOCUS350692, partial [marine metagenome]